MQKEGELTLLFTANYLRKVNVFLYRTCLYNKTVMSLNIITHELRAARSCSPSVTLSRILFLNFPEIHLKPRPDSSINVLNFVKSSLNYLKEIVTSREFNL